MESRVTIETHLIEDEKRYFACTPCDMLVILFIMKYHSVLPAVIANIATNPEIQFYKHRFVKH